MVIRDRQGQCCDAVLRQIERAVGVGRTGVSDPELTGKEKEVDLRATVGGKEYALEHTRILPFEKRMEAAKVYRTSAITLRSGSGTLCRGTPSTNSACRLAFKARDSAGAASAG